MGGTRSGEHLFPGAARVSPVSADRDPCLVPLVRRKESRLPWLPEEDHLIREMVQRLGLRRWCKMAVHLPTRTAKQIRERWHNQLDPNITRAPWSHEVCPMATHCASFQWARSYATETEARLTALRQ